MILAMFGGSSRRNTASSRARRRGRAPPNCENPEEEIGRQERNMPKTATRAMVVLDLSGPIEIKTSDNVEAVTEVDSESIVIHFAAPFPDELYRCDVIASGPLKHEVWTRT